MSPESPFILGAREGFSPQIGRLVGMLDYVRTTTLNAVGGLSTRQLDHFHDDTSNSIGMLLAHIAAVELAYQADTLACRAWSSDEVVRWGNAVKLTEDSRTTIRNRSLDKYLLDLERIRSETLRLMAEQSDDWLEVSTPFWRGQPANNHFKWFHVIEEELNHRGQIVWLRKRLPDDLDTDR